MPNARARSTVYYPRQETGEVDLALMRRIDMLHLEHPFAGSRMLRGLSITRPNHVGGGHQLYPDEARLRVPICGDGSGEPPDADMALVQYPDDGFLPGSHTEAIDRHGKPEIFNTD